MLYRLCYILNEEFSSQKHFGTFVLDEFEFESGQILHDVEVEYETSGVPRYDKYGNIINLIVFCPTTRGGQSLLNDTEYNHGFSLKMEEYFYIHITSLGIPGSCSPSNTGLKQNFPNYTFKDRVNFKRKFLKEKFNVTSVHGIAGEGLGGFEVFTWACEYPDEMEFIIVLNSSWSTSGFRYVISKGVESIIESTDDYYSDMYSSSLSKVMVSINKLLFSYYFPRRIFANLSNHEIDYVMDEYVDEGLFIDIYDFNIRNNCILNYDVKDKLNNIKAKSLFISTYDNMYFSPKFDTLPLKDLVKDSHVFLFESKRNHYYDKEDYSEMTEVISDFIKPCLEKMLKVSKD